MQVDPPDGGVDLGPLFVILLQTQNDLQIGQGVVKVLLEDRAVGEGVKDPQFPLLPQGQAGQDLLLGQGRSFGAVFRLARFQIGDDLEKKKQKENVTIF